LLEAEAQVKARSHAKETHEILTLPKFLGDSAPVFAAALQSPPDASDQ